MFYFFRHSSIIIDKIVNTNIKINGDKLTSKCLSKKIFKLIGGNNIFQAKNCANPKRIECPIILPIMIAIRYFNIVSFLVLFHIIIVYLHQ